MHLLQSFGRLVIHRKRLDEWLERIERIPTAVFNIRLDYFVSLLRRGVCSLLLWCSFLPANTAESHPALATRIKRAHKPRGQKLIVADWRLPHVSSSPLERASGGNETPAIKEGHPILTGQAKTTILP